MTDIKPSSPVTRRTAAMVQGRDLVVKLCPVHMEIRRVYDHTPYSISYDAVYRLGAQLLANQIRAEKKAAKKGLK